MPPHLGQADTKCTRNESMSGSSELKEKTAKGLFWGGISNGVQQLLTLVFGIFLARILSTGDYGLVGELTIFTTLATVIHESGFSTWLINHQDATDDDYNAVFWFNIIVCAVIYLILFACAGPIARFYGDPELLVLSRWSFVGILISGLATAQSAFMVKHLMIKENAIANIVALSISGVIGVVLAFRGFAYWAIVIQTLVMLVIYTAGLWYFSPWRPRLHIDLRPIGKMFSFSIKMLITNICTVISQNIFTVFLGARYDKDEVGSYNQANKWSVMGSSIIDKMFSSVSHPVLAQVRDDPKRQIRVFRKMVRFVAFVSFPAMLGLAMVAPEFITMTITDKWAPSIPILQLLCISGAFLPISSLLSKQLVANGRSDIFMWVTISLAVLTLGILFVSSPLGIRMMLRLYVALNLAWVLVWFFFVHRCIGYRLKEFLTDILPYLGISLAVLTAVYFATSWIHNIYALFFSRVALAAGLYMLVMRLSGATTYKETIQFLLRKKTNIHEEPVQP